ncbi:hypothetical protein P8452_28594 [Trifolium repens]|nr:hypothetical protein P8452_28594 [Trifolium repens]
MIQPTTKKVKLSEKLADTKSLTVTATTLQVLFLNANLLKIKLPSLGLEPSTPIPDGIVDFLIQNSPLAEVEIIDCSYRKEQSTS